MDDYGMRNNPADGEKSDGWLGPVKRPDGSVSTEISMGFAIDGKEVDIPLMVPGLTKQEIKYLINNDVQSKEFSANLPDTIMKKAIEHATMRMKQGKSPFKNAKDNE